MTVWPSEADGMLERGGRYKANDPDRGACTNDTNGVHGGFDSHAGVQG